MLNKLTIVFNQYSGVTTKQWKNKVKKSKKVDDQS